MTLNLHALGTKQPIATIEDWHQLAPPKKKDGHWRDGRSAMELARAFTATGAPEVPVEIRDLLASNPTLGPVAITEAIPEAKIALDGRRGEGRNADLAGVGTVEGGGAVTYTVEAKADEEFGPTIAARLKKVTEARSRLPERIRDLSRALFGKEPSEVEDLRYQLLHGVAASLILAGEQRATAAIFIVYEFNSPSCKPVNRDRNARDLNRLMALLGGVGIIPGVLQGPFDPRPGNDRIPSAMPLYVGKAVRDLT